MRADSKRKTFPFSSLEYWSLKLNKKIGKYENLSKREEDPFPSLCGCGSKEMDSIVLILNEIQEE